MLYQSNTDYLTFETTLTFTDEPVHILALFTLLHLAGYEDYSFYDDEDNMAIDLLIDVDDIYATLHYLEGVLADIGINLTEDTWQGQEYVVPTVEKQDTYTVPAYGVLAGLSEWWTAPVEKHAEQMELL